MNVTEQSGLSPSEMPIFHEGFLACDAGQHMSTNPYPAVCQDSLRDHWVWDQGWLKANSCVDY
jgi:hypothetical protein